MADPLRPAIRLRPNERRLLLVLGDLLASILAAFIALYVWRQYSFQAAMQEFVSRGVRIEQAERILRSQIIHVPFWFYLLPLGWLLLIVELYDAHAAVDWRRTLRGIALAAMVGIVIYALVFIFNQDPTSLPRVAVGAFIVLASLLTLFLRGLYIQLYTSPGLQRRVLILGAGKAGLTLAQVYCETNPKPFSLIGYIDDDFQKIDQLFEGYPVIGASKDLLAIIDQYRVSDVVMAITGEVEGSTFQTILDIQERGVEVTRMPTLYEEITQRVPVHHLESDWLIRSFVDQLKVSVFYELLKRLMDIIGGLLGFLIFAISFPAMAIATIIDSGFPILYSQDRLGKGGQAFTIYKYRTMYQNSDADGSYRPAAENDQRVTRLGNFLRSVHLDELPQFWNVLRGTMSLVGPRAERAQLVAEYQKQIPFYRARLLVKPGLTGWAQINYGYVANVTETVVKLEYDLFYIKHRSMMLDITIMLRTIGTVLSRGEDETMQCLVTGGAGFIGSHIVAALLDQGAIVRVLDNFSTGKRENLAGLKDSQNKGRLEVLQGDVRNIGIVTDAVRGVDTIFHEAAFVSVPASMEHPQECFDINVTGTSTLFEAARNAGVRRVVIASSAAVYGDSDALPLTEETFQRPLSPYAVSKSVDEMYAVLYTRSLGLEVVALRYFNVYGPRQRPDSMYAAVVPIFIRRLREGQAVTIFGDGGQTRDLIYVGDVARANLLAAEHADAPGQIFNICTGQECRILDLVNNLQQLFPVAPKPIFSAPRAGDIYKSLGSPMKAEKIFGFKTTTSLAEGLKATAEWMQ